MMPDTILTEIAKLNNFTRDMCFLNGHEATIFQHVSGETLYDATVNILTSAGEEVVTGVLLREAIVVYLQTHLIILTESSMNLERADEIYAVMSSHFYDMGITGFYVPLAMIKHNPKSKFIQYTVVVIPEKIRGENIATKMSEMVKANAFEAVSPHNESPFSDDAAKTYGNYVDIIACCLINKMLTRTDGTKTSD